MRTFNKISSIVLALCMAISLFAVPAYATTPVADVKDAISFSGEITKAEDELQVNFAIPEGLSDIRGVQFQVELPEGFAISSEVEVDKDGNETVVYDIETNIPGWKAHTGSTSVVIIECGAQYEQSLEKLFPENVTNSYNIATLGITTDKTACGENGQKIAKVTVLDITSGVGEADISNPGNTPVDVPFTLNIAQCTAHTGGTATCVDYAVCDNCGEPNGELNPNGHKYTNYVYNNNATCKADGTKTAKCDYGCGKGTHTVTAVGTKKAHSYVRTYVASKATLSADGVIRKACACGAYINSGKISKIKTVSIAASVAYTGKTLNPKVTVKDAAGKPIASTNYTVTYSKNKSVGKATAKVVFKNNYSGTKTLTFKIVPKKTSISSLKAGKKAFTVKYSKQTSGTGYEIQYSTSKSFKGAKTVKISKNKTVSKTVKKLKSKKTYYVRVRVTKGSSYKSSWSAVKKVKVK